MVENGSLPNQRVLTTTLVGLTSLAAEERVRPPALLIIGDVAAQAATQPDRCRGQTPRLIHAAA